MRLAGSGPKDLLSIACNGASAELSARTQQCPAKERQTGQALAALDL